MAESETLVEIRNSKIPHIFIPILLKINVQVLQVQIGFDVLMDIPRIH